MKKLPGYSLTEFPFPNLELVGTLLYHEFPSTVVYADEFNNPIILEWIDCDDQNKDHYLIYESSKSQLQKLISGLISHRSFIKNSKNNFIVSFEGKLGNESNYKVVFFDQLPKEYLPDADVYFQQEEGVQLNKIVGFFKLKLSDRYDDFIDVAHDVIKANLKPIKELTPISQTEILQIVAQQEQSEVINLHLKQGDKVGYGSIETHLLGEVLTKFDGLYREAALDFYEGSSRDNLRSLNSKRGKVLYPKITTEVVLNMAASFSVFIRPSSKNKEEALNSSIGQSLFSLFSKSHDKKTLSEVKDNYSVFVYKSYKEFLDIIRDSEIQLDCNLYNPFKDISSTDQFAGDKALQLLENIKELIQIDSNKFKLIAKFIAINCKTRHYTLISNNQLFNGHFDKQIQESMTSLSFTKSYEVTIIRKTEQIAGSKDEKITDTIISCIEVKDDLKKNNK